MAAADGDAASHAKGDVAFDQVAAVAVIEIDAERVRRVVDEIVADDVAIARPIEGAVEAAEIIGLDEEVVDLVEPEKVVVAAVEHRGVGRVVDEIVRHAAADGRRGLVAKTNANSRRIDFLREAVIVDVIVVHDVPRGCSVRCSAVSKSS